MESSGGLPAILLKRTGRRAIDAVVTLITIAFLALFALIMAERGRAHVLAPPLDVAAEAFARTVAWIAHHPATYLWHKVDEPALMLVLRTFGRSAGLLAASLVLASVLGLLLGSSMARSRGRLGSALTLLLSVIGVSTPSFLLAMLFWIVNVQLHQRLHASALPPTGFGWDQHLVMPALVLAMRPMAQIAQVTYVALTEVMNQDYVRTARAKGLSERLLTSRHVVPNIAVPVLTTLGTSLRFSLSSLPVVEYFFVWPGVGLALLEAIEAGNAPFVMDLIVALGLFFLVVNLALELVFPSLDPRLRDSGVPERHQRHSWRWGARSLYNAMWGVREWWRARLRRARGTFSPEDAMPVLPERAAEQSASYGGGMNGTQPLSATRRVARGFFGNPVVVVGTAMVLGMVFVAIFGPALTNANPYQTAGVMMVDGEIGAPPFQPSSTFPWGTDQIGRDVRALVFAGARQTLMLALFGTAARILLGTILGLLAGWWHGGLFDRVVTGAIGVWAAFPVTLFGMLIIQGLGIQQGTWVFIVALCVVGWGEVAQFVRRQVMSIQPELYVDAARSVGAGTTRILSQHILPQLLSPLLVLGILEMGGVLMLLAELGFLSIFLGGGFKVQIAEGARMMPIIAFFSDVPEWGAMLANIRDWWRSYPWMAWYPGVAFFLAILAFNLWGEGLRRFLNDSRINVSRLVNRYSLVAVLVVAVGLIWMLRGSSPLGVYQSYATTGFDTDKAMVHARTLASPAFEGRESGHPGATAAAEYIAGQMAEIGLFPAGDDNTFVQTEPRALHDLTAVPRLEILDAEGSVIEELIYRRDFSELADSHVSWGDTEGAIVGIVPGPLPDATSTDPYQLRGLDLRDKIILLHEPDLEAINVAATAGALIVRDDPTTLHRRQLYVRNVAGFYATPRERPVTYITAEVADRLLATAGSSLAGLDAMRNGLESGQIAMTSPGARVHLATSVQDAEADIYHVVGYIPGVGAEMRREGEDRGLDQQVIMVSAYYDGLGLGPDGTLYPGANDNASGVATLLELARALKESPYQPKKTVLFVAWSGGERYDDLSVTRIMNAQTGFNTLSVEAVLELSGVGAGDGAGLALGEDSSYRLVQLMQKAADRLKVGTTTRGRGPHYGMYQGLSFGGRDALTLDISWDGSDRTAHTPTDAFDAIDPEKLEQTGKVTLLTLTVLSMEANY